MKKKFNLYFKLFLFFVVTPAAVVGSFYALDQTGFFNISHVELELKTSHDQKNFAYRVLKKATKVGTRVAISIYCI